MSTPKTTLYPITDRQLATILAALRYWQRDAEDNLDGQNDVPDNIIDGQGHFEDHKPLSSEEIDELCESLNMNDDQAFKKQLEDARSFARDLGREREQAISVIYLLLANPSTPVVLQTARKFLADVQRTTPEYVETTINQHRQPKEPA